MPPVLSVRLWGVRGSVPAPGAGTRRHGGNTSCVSLHTPAGQTLVLDAGTGLRALGDELLRGVAPNASGPIDVALFLTHAHWDHVQGLPFFAPIYAPRARVAIHTPASTDGALEAAVRAQIRPPSFPVRFDTLSASIAFVGVDDHGMRIGDVRVCPIAAHHPGGAVGWRVDDASGARAVAYLPDNEIAEQGGHDLRPTWLDALRGCRLLLHDATYTPSELPSHRGWGHSSWEEAVRLAIEARVERLVLFHHHPDRSDTAVDRIVDEARAMARALGSAVRILGAAEGLVLHA